MICPELISGEHGFYIDDEICQMETLQHSFFSFGKTFQDVVHLLVAKLDFLFILSNYFPLH